MLGSNHDFIRPNTLCSTFTKILVSFSLGMLANFCTIYLYNLLLRIHLFYPVINLTLKKKTSVKNNNNLAKQLQFSLHSKRTLTGPHNLTLKPCKVKIMRDIQ